MIYSIEDIKTIVTPIARKHGIPAVFLFGSYARCTATLEQRRTRYQYPYSVCTMDPSTALMSRVSCIVVLSFRLLSGRCQGSKYTT